MCWYSAGGDLHPAWSTPRLYIVNRTQRQDSRRVYLFRHRMLVNLILLTYPLAFHHFLIPARVAIKVMFFEQTDLDNFPIKPARVFALDKIVGDFFIRMLCFVFFQVCHTSLLKLNLVLIMDFLRLEVNTKLHFYLWRSCAAIDVF